MLRSQIFHSRDPTKKCVAKQSNVLRLVPIRREAVCDLLAERTEENNLVPSDTACLARQT